MPDLPSTNSSITPVSEATAPATTENERVHLAVPARFRFRPRYRGLSISAGIIGALLVLSGIAGGLDPSSATWAIATGLIGLVLGGAYFVSPAWRLSVEVDDAGLAVRSGDTDRFRLRWDQVEHVLASATTSTCFVDGGEPGKSLLVPGPGASAPYRIDNRAALYAHVLAHVPATRVTFVDLIEKGLPAPADADGDTRAATPNDSSHATTEPGGDAAPKGPAT